MTGAPGRRARRTTTSRSRCSDTLHPPASIDPKAACVEAARRRRRRDQLPRPAVTAVDDRPVASRSPTPPSPRRHRPRAERAAAPRAPSRSERRLGWLLCAPAALVMLAVTAYPIGYAIYLSLQRADLRFPDANKFVGLDNYRVGALGEPVVAGPLDDGADHRDLGGASSSCSAWHSPSSCTGRSSAAGIVRVRRSSSRTG